VAPAPEQVARVAAMPPNDMQRSLRAAAMLLPTSGANVGAHVDRLASVPDPKPDHVTVAAALSDIAAHVKAFLGG